MARRTAALLCVGLWAIGATAQPARVAAGDPYLPPALRGQAQPAPTGAALEALVQQKLRRTFEAADTTGTGRITREQAAAAGWGSVARDFDRIDVRGAGQVSFDEIQRYLSAQARR